METPNTIHYFLANLTTRPGVYIMKDKGGQVLYVGKAKNLKKRVSSYYHRQLDTKTLQLVNNIHSIEVTVTRNEREALLLESNLIKEWMPRYNIVFRDDKSYPYLQLSKNTDFPRLSFYRGDKSENGYYYGPYPSSHSCREALSLLQGIFKLRQCDDHFFKSRTRPCLQYQIKRCTAPCVGYITKEAYAMDALHVKWFLEGKSQAIIKVLIERMETASQALNFEQAARIRDQIARLRAIQEQQIIMNTKGDVDVLGLAFGGSEACIHVLAIREGNILGTRQFFPDTPLALVESSNPAEEWLKAFITQHYLLNPDNEEIPKEILLSEELPDSKELMVLLKEKKGQEVLITRAKRGDRLKWLQMAAESAKHAYQLKMHTGIDLTHRFNALQMILHMEAVPERIECFDVSHSLGESTIASCVVFDRLGAKKSDYRRFNVKSNTKGDDYGSMEEALSRRYTRLKSEGGALPDLLIIDGGKGQIGKAITVLKELQVSGVVILGIAKGPSRKPGFEKLYINSNGIIKLLEPLDPSNPGLHLLQQIRDEAHRFAITAHRKQRAKRRMHSVLEDIPGIGKKRRLNLLRHFGGLQEVRGASIEELAKVEGISLHYAKRIYEMLHGE